MLTLQELRNGISNIERTFTQTSAWDFEKSRSYCINKDFKNNSTFFAFNKSDYTCIILELMCCSRYLLNQKYV